MPEAAPPPQPLLKEQLADALREAIMQGRLKPGERVIESRWARKLGAAQASVREAINLLMAAGFLVKDAGRSARVVRYAEEDVSRIFEVRGALEGLAAQLATAGKADLSHLDAALNAMQKAARRGDMRAVIQSDLAFHLALAEASGNDQLIEISTRLLTPLFAFILLRVLQSGQGPQYWIDDLPRHRRIVEVIREGNPTVAALHTQHTIGGFVTSAYQVWGGKGRSGPSE